MDETIALVRGGGGTRARAWIGFAVSLALFAWLSGAMVKPDGRAEMFRSARARGGNRGR